jgi:putative nucleotidyltransferase with HDIG domain
VNENLPLLDQIVEFADRHQITLPVMSDAAMKLQAAARSENFDMAVVEKAIDSDSALATEVLRAANSAFFGGLSEVRTVRMAIMRLGIQRVTNLVLLASEKNRYTAKSPTMAALMRRLWHHASACALASEWIARHLRLGAQCDEAFIGGLMHDIGKLFLARVLDEMAADPTRRNPVSEELALEVMATAHTDQGHRLLTAWNLPEIYRTIVRDHHAETFDPSNAPLVVVRLANISCAKMGVSLHSDPSIVLASTPEAQALGMTEVALAELEIILEDVEAIAA